MKRSSRTRAVATFSVSALSLVLITGCGGDSDAKDTKDTAGKPSAPAATAEAIGKGELEKLIVATADVEGYDVKPAGAAQQIVPSKDALTVKDAACEPLAYVLTGFAPGDEKAFVNRVATQAAPTAAPSAGSDADLDAAKDLLGSTITIVSLSSYDGDGAQRTMKAVKDAVSGCAGGFTFSAEGQEAQQFTKVAPGKPVGSGDESAAFTIDGKTDGGETTVNAEVVRHGSTVATYYALNLAALAGKKADTSIPEEIVTAQESKLK
ncbi:MULTISPECIES: hypothetical protein [Streptomyces]|uniref:PknH-like extracellular domain-containing protein n=1 Tax=Streptomyces doudnae TaxID=3075536 RepID=A0ABD5EJ77_9ACTN|nr:MULTISPECIES: hypothetical protein [unclassified Streptomyces]MDT0434355.1 hypothetical protein [Streptomyces sp. DSM 41981]MYQ63986.1 hypothetical protein [Streptomyces sp. SID4950]SCD69652.1 hypothetical protein GA0115242_11245 [Streptomyces sp. SolWspMP-5a-2]